MNAIFHKILVPIDFSEAASAALAQAAALGKSSSAEVTVVHVVPRIAGTTESFSPAPETYMATWQPAENATEVEHRLQAASDQQLREAVSVYRDEGVEINSRTLWGTPFIEVIQTVLEEGYDLVVVGTRGRSAVSRMLVGSTAAKLVRKCPCPVWIVKPPAKTSFAAILAPIDFAEVSHESLRLAAALAAHSHASLHVLHVFAPEHSYFLDLLPEDELELSPPWHRHELIARLRMFVRDSGVPVEPVLHVERGDVGKRILSTARRVDADLIVMGTLGRAGVAGLLIGNTAEKIVHTSDRALLAVKPLGFVSPVLHRFASVEA